MDKELKAKWVEALRSGEYKQCRGDWHRDDGYCCVGVLLKVKEHNMQSGHLRRVAAALGISDLPDKEYEAGSMQNLIDMNDRDGKNFAEIADYIEANL